METPARVFSAPRLFVIGALALAGWALVFKTGVASSDEAGIVLHLPDRVGDWQGIELLFCPSRDCGAQYAAAEVQVSECPRCGAELGHMNWAEREMLPADTGLVRKYYERPGGREPLHATIVLSGDDRSSIHRPQVCMTAAGHDIQRERLIHIPLAGRPEPLEVTVLEMAKPYPRSDGSAALYTSYYAYWFVGKDRETASHLKRMFWMGYDRVVHGVSHRWAYIAISGERDPRSDGYLQTIADFASQLHPALLKTQ